MHDRLSVSAVSSWRASFDEDLAMWERLGIEHVGLSLRKCEEVGLDVAVRGVRDAGLRVSNVVECGWCELADAATWPAYRDRLLAAIDAMQRGGAPVLVLTTGPAGPLEWEDAARALGEVLDPVIAAANVASAVRVAIENTSPMRLDLSFATTLRDTVDLADQLDVVRVRGAQLLLGRTRLRRHRCARGRPASRTCSAPTRSVGSLTTPDRLVPGDGDIPLASRIGALAAAGYAGAFEIEMVGPRIEAEGYESAIRPRRRPRGRAYYARGDPFRAWA